MILCTPSVSTMLPITSQARWGLAPRRVKLVECWGAIRSQLATPAPRRLNTVLDGVRMGSMHHTWLEEKMDIQAAGVLDEEVRRETLRQRPPDAMVQHPSAQQIAPASSGIAKQHVVANAYRMDSIEDAS